MLISHTILLKALDSLCIDSPKSELMLFAIRGALPTFAIGKWSSRIRINGAKPDYKHFRCSIGIWDPVQKKVLLVPGSTVPHISQVKLAAKKNGKGANQMEWGLYDDFTKGEHLQGKPKGHLALRQTSNRFIRRTTKGAPYNIKDKLYFSNPYDNLHCGWNKDWQQEGYSSAGCIVVAGWPFCPRSPEMGEMEGPWKTFQAALYASPQKKFSLLLIEFQKLEKILNPTYKGGLLCFGSRGEKVKLLQKKLKDNKLYTGTLHGQLDSRTYKAWDKLGFKKL